MTSAVEQLDIAALTHYLESYVEGFKGPIQLEKFSGGQSNPTFKVIAASGTYVLRRQPPGKLLKSAHAVDREYRVLSALAATDVPVAKVFHLCEDCDVIGSMFYLMEFLPGRIFWDSALPEASANEKPNEERAAIHQEIICVMAKLHNVDVEALGLTDYGKPGNYYQRQIKRWSIQYRASEIDKIEAMEQLMTWLQANMPADDGLVSIAHGDYRLDNVMFHPDKPEIIAILDWELSTLGHPYADLAYHCMQLRMPPESPASKGLMGIDRETLGIPSEQEIINLYCQLTGIEKIDHWPFYLAFCFFRLAAIAQGVAKRATQGNASSKQAEAAGNFVGPLAQMALQIIKEG
ncbi:phosphotransferase family protein [Colwellia demingiae]|uniref:Phosphotransferase family protein n=1 Tax=Colwellia demingiae TaxID=89401 RepID=A0A5C6QGY8_9GAMM|nr:phosphotransferase family protein [Colwellia demingiae]TWX68071.1 phosphotransferase family protein [Colwellia demingiae]